MLGTVSLALLFASPARAGDADGDGVSASAQLQVWGTVWDQDVDPQADPAGYGDPEHDTGVGIHRARLGLGGLHGPVDWNVEIGASEPYDAVTIDDGAFGLVDAYAGVRWAVGPGSERIAVGIQKVPVSRELLISSTELLFQERAVVTEWLAPGRDLGALADWRVGVAGLRARFGVFNGGGDVFGDETRGKRVVLRVETEHGDSYRTWSPDGAGAFGAGASASLDHDLGIASRRLGADALARVGRFALLAEGAFVSVVPTNTDVAEPDVLAGTSRMGALLQASWFVPVEGRGGIEIGARGAYFDDRLGAFDNGDVLIAHAGATWRDLWPSLDAGAGFVHREELAGARIGNDTARLWVQLHERARIGGGGAPDAAAASTASWAQAFVGTWSGQGTLEGATIALWEQPGLGLVGSFRMSRPMGQVVIDRPYPLDSFSYDAEPGRLRVRLDPYGEGRSIVWFELAPSAPGQLCGFGYEDGKRDEAVNGRYGAWVCWNRSN